MLISRSYGSDPDRAGDLCPLPDQVLGVGPEEVGAAGVDGAADAAARDCHERAAAREGADRCPGSADCQEPQGARQVALGLGQVS